MVICVLYHNVFAGEQTNTQGKQLLSSITIGKKKKPGNNHSSHSQPQQENVPHLSMTLSSMACTTSHRAQGFDLASKLP